MNPPEKGHVQSVRQRLLNLSHRTGEDYNQLLTRYATERLLFRLGESEHANHFILKGAMLFLVWQGASFRPTRDLDFLAFGSPSDEDLSDAFSAICRQAVVDDGMRFDADSITTTPIRDEHAYAGFRLRMNAYLGNARIAIRVDVGFGDVVTPDAPVQEYPVLLDDASPRVSMYTPQTVIAEKLEAMVSLGIANSRMKDFYDVWMLLTQLPLSDKDLKTAIHATFTRRQTAIPTEIPLALTSAFSSDPDKQKQWAAFLNRSGLPESRDLHTVIDALQRRLVPLLQR